MAGADGKKGDLLIEIHIDPDSEYTRKGLDLYTSAQIPYSTAVLGGEAMLPTLHGQVSCKIPAGIQSGSKIRLKEKGIHTEGRSPKKGDEFVEIRIAVPRNISPAAKKKLEEYAAGDGVFPLKTIDIKRLRGCAILIFIRSCGSFLF